MMNVQKTDAFVLKASKYSETSLIVSLYTLDEGKVRCIAKGARRPKSPFAGKLDPLSELEVVYVRGRSELYTLKECSIIKTRMPIRDDLDRLNAALRVISLLDETQTACDPSPGLFSLVREVLDEAATTANLPSLLVYFRLKLLAESGYALDLETCAGCGNSLASEAAFSGSRTGFLCGTCRKEEGRGSVPRGTLEILRRIRDCAVHEAQRIRLSARQSTQIDALFRAVFESILERRSSSTRILDSMQ